MTARHPTRREDLLAVMVRIVSDRGLEELTFREVAAGSGVSIGTVQHHFGGKDDMLLAAFEHVADIIRARATRCDGRGPLVPRMARSLQQLLPLDEARTVESRVCLAFDARAAVEPRLAEVEHRALAEIRDGYAAVIAKAQRDGLAPPTVRPSQVAGGLAALVDGLRLQMLSDPPGMPARTAKAILGAHLRALLETDGTRAKG